jgi:hypothetical protein
MISWSVEWWSEDGDVIDYVECDDWEDIHDVVDDYSHKISPYDTIAICVVNDVVDEDERWTI